MQLNSWLMIDWSGFHFLRPQALWALPVILFIVVLLWFAQKEDGKWKKLIAPHLRSYVFTSSNERSFWWPLCSFILISLLASLALAGPSWKQVETPGVKTAANLVILLDASWSMMTEDISPNRLERAKLKINDLLGANPGSGISLFVYAGTPHAVLPNTTDYDLVAHHTEFLTSGMMPVLGSDLTKAMIMMDSVFNRFSAPSTLLLITDGISQEDLPSMQNFLTNTEHRVELLTMATANGGEIPGLSPNSMLLDDKGNKMVARPDLNVIEILRSQEQFYANALTLDKTDVEAIAVRMRQNLVFELDGEPLEDQWQDEGLILLIPVLLLSLLFFRKGFMIQWCLIFMCLVFTACSPDNKLAYLWYSADYRGQLLEADSLFLEAAETYENLQRKAIAYYKAGDFEASAALFEQDSSMNGQYNLGLSLIKLGRFEEAQQVFEKVQELGGDNNSEMALDQMIEMVKDERLAADSINRFDPTEVLENNDSQEPLKERRASSKDEELSSDTEAEELPTGGDRVTDEVETDMVKAEELEKPPKDMDVGKVTDAQNIMLRGISPDPSEFLRRRFKLQQEKYYPNIKAKQRH